MRGLRSIVPVGVRRIATLALLYLLTVAAAGAWLPHEWDWAVFERLSSLHPPAFSPQVTVVDVPWNSADIPQNRRRLAALRPRTARQDEITMAINASRFIVPVYTETYFSKSYCRYEIRRAHRNWLAGNGAACVLPFMRVYPTIDATVDDIQAASIDDHPDLVREILAQVISGAWEVSRK